MRQNLTNVKETQLDKVDSFYVVGSTTKEGLIEGKSNVKIDLKKAVAEGGGGSEDVQKLFEMFFGQMPYVCMDMVSEPLPITEYSLEELESNLASNGLPFVYKEQEPVSRVRGITGGGTDINAFSMDVVFVDNIDMIPAPVDLPNGPWYYPSPAED